jgi:hypothetical protein
VTIALFKQAKEAFGAGDYQQAVAYFDQALLLRHDLYRVYRFNLFSALAKLKEVESVRGASAWRTTASEASHREAQEEAELLLNQLFLVQEELERYFLLYQESQSKLNELSDEVVKIREATAAGQMAAGKTGQPIGFVKWTQINAPGGLTRVDALQRNQDLICQNQSAQVKWIGYQRRTREFAQFEDYLPVKISAGALDENLPIRDLYLSPNQAVLIDEHLVHAKALVNGKSIVHLTDWEGDIEYYHIETNRHDIIYAEGVPCETFSDSVSREQFDNYAEYQALYPNTRMIKELPLPRVKTRHQLPQAIEQRLQARIDHLGKDEKG